MSPIFSMILTGAVVGAGIYLLVNQFVPGVPALGRALERLNSSPSPTLEIKRSAPLSEQVGTRLQRRLGTYGDRLTLVSEADLEILSKPRYELLGEKAVAAGLGFLFGPFTYVVMVLGGVGVGYLLPTGVSLVAAIGLWFLPDFSVRDKAKAAREEYAAAASAYLDLVAIARVAGDATNEAMRHAAGITGNAAFRRIDQALKRSTWAGTPPWDALVDLKTSLDVPELGDVADIMRLAGEGGQVINSLRQRARALRDAQLTEEHARAQSQSERLTMAMSLTGVVFLLMLLYPAATTMLG